MEIQYIKQIAITDYLEQQGYTPARVQGIHYWYCSPLRKESTPSFKVSTERNQWYDFGTGEHGDIIDLVCALQHCTISKAIELLGDIKQVAHRDFSFGGESKASEHKLVILSAQPLNNPYLIHYIVHCQTKVNNSKYSYLLCYFILLLSKILLLIEFYFIFIVFLILLI